MNILHYFKDESYQTLSDKYQMYQSEYSKLYEMYIEDISEFSKYTIDELIGTGDDGKVPLMWYHFSLLWFAKLRTVFTQKTKRNLIYFQLFPFGSFEEHLNNGFILLIDFDFESDETDPISLDVWINNNVETNYNYYYKGTFEDELSNELLQQFEIFT